ncbi:MAG: hypothetical protein METHP_02026 [Methanoregula sp. SKADARSKE-2]|nr:MAG: hypothetical protein METHP_02026 [Methanoregula sp. SKADARSKE-2]
MPETEPRRYQKIDEAEINLVIECKDSHEFYERYRSVFPDRKKGIDSISKIWKRRGDFIKKRLLVASVAKPAPLPAGSDLPAAPGFAGTELEKLIAAQNAMLGEVAGIMNEQLGVSRKILLLLEKQHATGEEAAHHHEAKAPEQRESGHKPKHEAPSSIVVGS